ncbi:MAG: hypothetical protein GEU91_10320 [Rhizobiales bacterium]|nr:hypothetical protein [Hyphomicrobiales bacterium]
MTRLRIALLLIAAAALAAAAWATVPRAIDAAGLLAGQDDPVALADRKVALMLDAGVAAREIESALTANDTDLAQSFVDLAKEHQVPVAPALAARVATAVEKANSPSRTAENFAKGLLTGEPNDLAGFAGTAVGDLFVFGDVRDAVREGARLAAGQEVDRLVLGLACVGLAVTAGTYATLGGAAPVRVGLTVAKAARKTGRLGAGMADWLGRSLREVVDWGKFRSAIAGATLTRPAVAIRAAREAVKLDKAGGIIDVVRDVGRVQGKAGTQAAFDGLNIAQGPADVARIAKLAEKKGRKTRAILKLLGRGAIVLAVGSMQLLSWILWAILALFGFASSTKGAVERFTMRRLQRRKQRTLAEQEQEIRNRRLAALALGPAARV